MSSKTTKTVYKNKIAKKNVVSNNTKNNCRCGDNHVKNDNNKKIIPKCRNSVNCPNNKLLFPIVREPQNRAACSSYIL